MNQLILANELLNYISTLQKDQNINDWICRGKTDITYGSPNGGWNGMNGFLFVKNDESYSFVIRSIPKEDAASYIVIESLNLKGQLYNMDLSNPRICKEKQGKTYLLESYRMTVGKGKKKEKEVENSFKSFNVNTNEVTVIDDINPNWSKTLTDILEWAILREKVKLDLKSNNKSIDTRFAQIIEDFKVFINEEKTKIIKFSFKETHPKYVWINDAEEKIGRRGFCHYELITRDKYPNKIFVEIHFDQKYKKKFENLITPYINNQVRWNKEHESKHKELSLAFNESYDFDEEELFSKLADALNYLESNFGAIIRSEFKNIFLDSNSLDNNMKIQPLNQILYGPPGTGKTYNTINKAIAIANPDFDLKQNRDLIKVEYKRLVETGQIVFTTFHQSMSYEDFIEGIKPETKNEKVTYEIKEGVFKKLCKEASAKKTSKNFDDAYSKFIEEVLTKGSIFLETPTHKKKFKVIINSNETAVAIPETEKGTNMGVTKEMSRDYVVNGTIRDWKPYTTSIGEYIKKRYPVEIEDIDNSNKKFVLIIDEINRGNVSQIFGELITLIEDDKRLGKDEALEVTLPYSKDKFGVPANLFIIGTMNTADRSVESLDSALRRRFSFVEMEPKPNLIKTESKSGKVNGIVDGIDLETLLKTINTRIEKLIDKDHRIGHSYFLKVNDSVSLHHSFTNEIIPLLEEYFFGDFGKIGLVLGSSFVEKVNHSFSFAKFDEYDTDIQEDLKQKSVFKIRNEEDWKFSEI
ncbi:AAA family ATPase [Flavobacterium sp. XS2P24]|uniref:McrB family protein n=1 Tax=Flavobacterium sp. XS2P24 TaxID=3041249 RepID=UPI0024A9E9F7|nr:AAA family ATPase [Flavobacterium sp. XS2P24]MDI6049406.1 AAA family ATPase [Flavobacterium sp. XS2P24]